MPTLAAQLIPAAFFLLATMFSPHAAAADQGADSAACFGNAVGDANVAACGRLIDARNLRGAELVRAHLQRAIFLSRRGDDYERVIADADRILEIEPQNVDALVLRGASLQRRGQSKRAQDDIAGAVRLGPSSVLSHNGLASYYNLIGDHDRALAAATESLRLSPDGLYGRKNRADSYEGKGELEKALADFRTVLARDPQKTERAGRESAEAIARIERKLAARAAPPNVPAPSSVAAPSNVANAAGRRVALVIGNDRYQNVPPLQKAVNDARAVADRLTRLGFDVIRVENADRRTMNQKLSEMTGRLSPGDTAFFFFAGHGIAVRDTNFLLPVDVPPAREGQEGLVSRESIGADAVVEAMRERGARVSLLVLDACRDNPFKTAGSRGIGGSQGLAQMQAPEGVFVLYSAGFGQTALDRLSDSDSNPNSVFTRTFVQLLDRPGLSVQELAKITQSEVRKLAASVNHVQMPAYYDQIDGTLALSVKSAGTGSLSHVMYRRYDGPQLVTGDLRRIGTDEWLETNTRGSRWLFRTTSESSSEIVLFDASRNTYVRVDLTAQKVFVRTGTTEGWRPLADIVGPDR